MTAFGVGDVVVCALSLVAYGRHSEIVPPGTAGRVICANGFLVGVCFGKRVAYIPSSVLFLVEKAAWL